MKKIYFVILCTSLLSFALSAQTPCSLDNTFNSNGRVISDINRIGEQIVALPDGSALIAYNPFGNGHAHIRHIFIDGSIDMSYGNAGKTVLQVASLRTDIKALLVLNNELYVCGNTGTGSTIYAFVAKLNSNGIFDASFGNAGYVDFPTFYTFNDMVFEPGSNRILVAGMKSTTKAMVTRLHTNGFMDGNFGNLGSTIISSASSSTYYSIDDIHIDHSGKLMITGKHYTTMGTGTFTQIVVMRFEADGAIDNTFDLDGKSFYNSQVTGSHEEGRRIFADTQNDYYVCGASYTNGSNWNYAMLKIKNDGTAFNSFGTNGWMIYDLTNQSETETMLNAEMMSNGNFLLTGTQGSGDTVHFAMLMVKPDGLRDINFAPNGLFLNVFGINNNSASAGLAITQDGKIYLSGYTRTCTGGTCGSLYLAVSRYLGANYPNAINDITYNDNLFIYPNPMNINGQFKIIDDFNTIQSIDALNFIGQHISIKSLGNNGYQIVKPSKGNYFVQLNLKDGSTTYQLIMIE